MPAVHGGEGGGHEDKEGEELGESTAPLVCHISNTVRLRLLTPAARAYV
jgi:hypothetical protein